MTGVSFHPTDDVARDFIIACKLQVYVGRREKRRSGPVEAVPPLCGCHWRSDAHSEALFQLIGYYNVNVKSREIVDGRTTRTSRESIVVR